MTCVGTWLLIKWLTTSKRYDGVKLFSWIYVISSYNPQILRNMFRLVDVLQARFWVYCCSCYRDCKVYPAASWFPAQTSKGVTSVTLHGTALSNMYWIGSQSDIGQSISSPDMCDVVFVSTSWPMPVWYTKLGRGRFLPNLLQFINQDPPCCRAACSLGHRPQRKRKINTIFGRKVTWAVAMAVSVPNLIYKADCWCCVL